MANFTSIIPITPTNLENWYLEFYGIYMDYTSLI